MTVANEIDRLQHLSTAELAAEYERLHGRPPRYRSRPWMQKRIAHAIQIAAFGGLSRRARAAIDGLNQSVSLPHQPDAATSRDKRQLRPGTVLQRDWRGQQVRVEVAADGFAWNGDKYTSLSALAFAVTGVKWNGRLFFGLTGRK